MDYESLARQEEEALRLQQQQQLQHERDELYRRLADIDQQTANLMAQNSI